MEIKKISKYEYMIEKTGKMKVPVRIFASEKLIESMKQDETFKQAKNVAELPGLIENVVLCPDAHMGYGMPIGGVAGFDLDSGVIAPGMVGFDINCGVRVLATDISKKEFMGKREKVIHDIKRTIPSGLGRGGKKYSREEIKQVLKKGAKWAVENNLGKKEDLERTEENGCIEGVKVEDVSDRAISRGLPQLGTLGAGNHFIDVLEIQEIYNKQELGLEKGNIAIMIHCGSRGLGHQIASDYLKIVEENFKGNISDKELVYAKIDSDLGKKYLSAMRAAVNFAFCNRQIIMHRIREILEKYFPGKKTKLVYDIAHNIAKIEKHLINVKKKEILVVRKGATRSFKGQPVLIPGSMSTESFVLIGKGNEKSFCSSAHGAGRAHSRSWAHKTLTKEKVKKILEKKDIVLEGGFKATIEESELSYKNVEDVIEVTEKANLSEKISKLKPLAVVIG